ncbi:MAG: polysaccharide biosynthesis tyrosine autokinase [Gammaproteobacteria bacterium]|nr:polysaccharide biosynthesis tyrosine autokinase [Gammaproteobacteria bacterium]
MDVSRKEMAPERMFEEEVIDLREYWSVLMRHRLSIMGLAFIFSLVAVLVVFSMDPIYRSTATLLIESQKTNVVSIEEVYGLGQANEEYYKTQFEILKSRDLSKKVIEKLNLAEHPEFLPEEEQGLLSGWVSTIKTNLLDKWLPVLPGDAAAEEELAFEKLVVSFQESLNVAPVRKSQLAHISFEAKDRKLAALVANTVSETYIENDLQARMDMTTRATRWLTERLDGLRLKLRQSEQALQTYKEKEGLIEGSGVSTLTAQHIQDLNAKLVSAKQRMAVAETSLKQIKKLQGKGMSKYLSIPAVLRDPLMSVLKEKESEARRRVSSLSKRYGPKHPRMIQAKAGLAEARDGINTQIKHVISGVEKEFQVAKAEENVLKRSLGSRKGEMQKISSKGYEQGVLEREVEANKQLYDMFMGRFKETSETTGMESANARIADPAVPGIEPVKPKKKLIVLIAGFMGMFIGILLAFLLEHLDNTIKTAAKIEETLKLPVLGILPHLKINFGANETPLKYARENPQSFFTESIRTIRTGILLSSLDEPHKIIVVTSSIPGEGKSTVSMNLADSLGEMKKVLLVDADMRRPSIAKVWGLGSKHKGLSEFVAGNAELKECVHQVDGTKVFVMPSGEIPPNPLELLSSQRFINTLIKLGDSFEHIVVDSAPSLAVSDSLVLASQSSGVIYVIKSDATPAPMVQEGIKRLREVGSHLIGGVLNDVSEEKGKKGYGKYGYYTGNYYGSYGYTSDNAKS